MFWFYYCVTYCFNLSDKTTTIWLCSWISVSHELVKGHSSSSSPLLHGVRASSGQTERLGKLNSSGLEANLLTCPMVDVGCPLGPQLELSAKTPTCGLSVRLKLTHNTVAEFQRQVSRETDQTNHRALLPPHFLRRRVVPAFRERGIRSHLWKEVGLNICRHILKLPQMIRGKRRVSLTRGKTVTVSFSDR